MGFERTDIEDSYPLSPLQQGMLFHSLYAPGSGIDIEQMVCAFHEALDVPAFERAWQRVVGRHPVLRTSFRWQDLEQPVQQVHRRVECPLEQHDWRDLSPEKRNTEFTLYLQADRRDGFDLARPPLMRLALFRYAEADYRCVWTFHHALMDGRSFPLVLKEVFAFYEAFRQGEDLRVSSPRPYRDYIDWLQQQDFAKAEAFWRRTLHGFATPTPLVIGKTTASLPTNGSRVGGEGSHGVQELWLPEALTVDLEAAAEKYQLTVNTFVQAAWALLLGRYSGGEDVVFGVTRACRRSALEGAGTNAMVGLFINTLPARVPVSPDASVLELLRDVRAFSLAMRDDLREHTPLSKIQEWSDVPRGVPLFESILVFERSLLNSALRAQGGDWEKREFELLGRTNYPLTLTGYGGESMFLRLKYDGHRFQDGAARRMLDHLQVVLQSFVADPEQRLADVPILTPAERYQLLVQWNDTRADFPSERCVHRLFEAQAERVPEAAAVAFEGQQLTYRELNSRANRLAHHLRALGVGPEALVGLCVERSLDMMVGILGILKAGGAYVPLDPALPQERLALILEDTCASVVLTQREVMEHLPQTRPQVRIICLDADWDDIAQESAENPVHAGTDENLAYVLFTSGSTGRPKGVAVEHRQLVNYVDAILERLDLPQGASYATVSTIAADLGNTAIFPALCTGGCLHVISQDRAVNPDALADYFDRYPVDCLKIVPSHLAALLSAARPEKILPRRRLVLGGEASSWTLIERVRELAPDCGVLNHYGPTETTVGTSTYRVARDRSRWAVDGELPETVPIGRPIANARIYLLDAQLQPVPVGVPGELCVGGAGLARGYLNRPHLTAERFIPDPFGAEPGGRLYRTGDLARRLADGSIEFLGRVDFQVKIRGFRVELGEIESTLLQYPGVQEGIVLAREDAPGRQQLVAYLVPGQGHALAVDDLRRFLQGKLPDYMVPTAFVVLEALPLTPNGKINRRALPAPDASRSDSESYVAPRTQAEATLADIWAQVLRVEQIGVHDDFFELGGDSILSIQIVARANQAGLQFTPRQLFQHSTIAELAAVAGTAPVVQAEQGVVTGSLPLTPIQHRFFEKHLPRPQHWNMSLLLEARQPLDAALLGRALQYILSYHDALRLRFVHGESGWRQFNADLDGAVPLSRRDLSALSPVEQWRTLEAGATELQAGLDLAEGPLVRAALFDLGPREPARLLVAIHHMAVDGVSWRILLEDLQTAYQQLERGERIELPPKTTSFKHWAERLNEYAKSAELREELDYWLTVARSPVPQLPVDYPNGRDGNIEASARTVSMALDAEQTRILLQEVPAVYQTQINDLLLTALTQAFARWTGSPRLLLDLEGHGREEIVANVDLSRTVGWFTTVFPVLLDLQGITRSGNAIKSVKEQLRRIPHKGIGYGLLRYLSDDPQAAARLRTLLKAEVSFNYLGQFDQTLAEHALFGPVCESSFFGRTCEVSGPSRGLEGERAYLLDIIGSIARGRLQVDWTYSANVHRRETVERLARDFVEALRVLIAHCRSPQAGGYTPSDFPEAGLSQEELDVLLEELGALVV